MSKSTIRFIVKRAEKGFNGRAVFAHSYGAADSMYDDQSVAQRQAQGIGDQVWKIDLSQLVETNFQFVALAAELVFTREPKVEKPKKEPRKPTGPIQVKESTHESNGESYGIDSSGEYYTRTASGHIERW